MLLKLVEMAFKRMMEYRMDVLYSLLLLLFPVVVWPSVWYFLTDKASGDVAGWGFPELVFISFFFSSLLGLADILGFWDVFRMFMTQGRMALATWMTKPLHPAMMLFGINLSLAELPRVALNMALAALVVLNFNISIGPSFYAAVALAFLIFMNFMLLMVSLLVAFDRSAVSVARVFWVFVNQANLPLDKLGGVAHTLLYYVIPIAFMAVVPAKSLVGEIPTSTLIGGSAVAIALTLLNIKLWDYGFKRFEAIGG